jgi:hypothetical protein
MEDPELLGVFSFQSYWIRRINMASALFPLGREGFLDGSIDWDTNDIRAMLVKSTYVYDAADKFLSDLGAVDNGRTGALGTKTVALGVAGSADTTLTATAGVACNAIVVFQHTGSDATARLIAYIDSATGLPFTPAAGQAVNIAWDTGVNKIFKL